MNYYIFIPIGCFLLLSYFLVYIAAQRRFNAVNRAFFLYMLSYALWMLSYKFVWLPLPDGAVMPVMKVSFFLWLGTSFLFLRFIYVFCGKKFDIGYRAHAVLIGIGVVVGLATDLVFNGFRREVWGAMYESGPLMGAVYLFCFVFPVLHASVTGVMTMRRSNDAARKKQLALIVIGSVLTLTGGIVLAKADVLFGSTAVTYPYFPLAAVFQASFVFWAVLKYNFLTIDTGVLSNLFNPMFEDSPDGIVIADAADRIVRMNRAARNLFGIDDGSPYPPTTSDLLPQQRQVALWHDQCITLNSELGNRVLLFAASPYRGAGAEGGGRILFFHDVTVQYDAERQLKEAKMQLEVRVRERTAELLDANNRLTAEIQERMTAEERMSASLHEKEVLLKEVHHRVKNNLQIVSSLLNLQSRQIRDKHDRVLFLESQDRIRSIALIHEKLYRSRNMARIDLKSYIHDLVTKLRQSYLQESASIRMSLDVAEASLMLDSAIPCGLIINELVSNAFKYAFAENESGEIAVSFSMDDDGLCTLVVADDGCGMPADVDPDATDTLGLQLVSTLVSQLDGRLIIVREKGTRVEIAFTETT